MIGHLSRYRHEGPITVQPGETETRRPYISIKVGTSAEVQIPVDDLAELNAFLRDMRAAIEAVRAR